MNAKIELNTVLKELHNISGFRISLYDMNLHEIAAYPRELSGFCGLVQQDGKAREFCVHNDAEAFETVRKTGEIAIYHCKFGLYEAVAPLYHFGELSGYLMMGQTLDDMADSRAEVYRRAAPYVGDREKLRLAVEQIPSSSREKILSCISIMNICAGYITLSNRLNPADKNLASSVKKYINGHYWEKITISLLCSRFFCSKSTLNNAFKQEYGKTIVRYLNEVRLREAAQLLENSGESIYRVAGRCGFSDQNYFSKVFQKEFGETPTQFRRRRNNNP